MASQATETRPPINVATESDTEHVIAVLALAFSSDPVARWVYPGQHQYWTHWPDLIRRFGGSAFECRTAYYAEGYAGASLWLPPGIHPDEDALVALLQLSVREPDQGEIFGVLDQMQSYHPTKPHWYLPMIGVDPTRQGRGYGSALIRHAGAVR